MEADYVFFNLSYKVGSIVLQLGGRHGILRVSVE